MHVQGISDYFSPFFVIICCSHKIARSQNFDFVTYRGKKIGDAGALIVARSLQYYTDIQNLE